jgi:hypothetical protein
VGSDTRQNIDPAAGRVELHVLAVPHLDVDPIRTPCLELLDSIGQVSVVGPEQAGCDLDLLFYATDSIPVYMSCSCGLLL